MRLARGPQLRWDLGPGRLTKSLKPAASPACSSRPKEALIYLLETESTRAPARNWSEPPLRRGYKDLGGTLSVALTLGPSWPTPASISVDFNSLLMQAAAS